MIYINRPLGAPSQYINHQLWMHEESQIRKCLNNRRRWGDRQLPGRDSPRRILGFWEELCAIFHNKCAYCESALCADAQLLLHRPRDGALQNKKFQPNENHKDHYYWLRWKWSNMYPACDDCSKNKGYLFPIERERVKPDLNTYGAVHLYIKEKPLLLDPCLDNPAYNLEFHDDGRVAAKDNSKRGNESIMVLALNRAKIVNARKKHADELNTLLQSGLDLMDENQGALTPEVEALIKQLGSLCEAHQPFAGMKRQLLHGWLQAAISSPNTSQEVVSALKSKSWRNLVDQLDKQLKEPMLIRQLLLQLYSCREEELETLCQYISLDNPKILDETAIEFIHKIVSEAQKQRKLSDVLAWIESQEKTSWSPGRADDSTNVEPASITASAIPMSAVTGKSVAAPTDKGVTGLSQTLNSPGQSVSRYDFFIVYATPDRRLAQDLCWFLQDDACKVFLDVQGLSPGAIWPSALREALEASRVIVVLVSTHADDAFYQQEEIVRAIELARDKPGTHTVIPVILEKLPQGAVSMPYGMSSLQAHDATRSGGLERVAAKLVAWLKDHSLDAK